MGEQMMSETQTWLAETRKVRLLFEGVTYMAVRPHYHCADGFTMSIQASDSCYCEPRDNNGPYSAVEIGYPSEMVEQLMPYAEDPDRPTDTVYGRVPIEVVDEVIKEHGGRA